MNIISSERLTDWTWGTALVTLAVLGFVLLVPAGFIWATVVMAGVATGVVLATALVVRSRRAPTLEPQLIESEDAASVAGKREASA